MVPSPIGFRTLGMGSKARSSRPLESASINPPQQPRFWGELIHKSAACHNSTAIPGRCGSWIFMVNDVFMVGTTRNTSQGIWRSTIRPSGRATQYQASMVRSASWRPWHPALSFIHEARHRRVHPCEADAHLGGPRENLDLGNHM